MTYDEFAGKVQHYARLGTQGDTVRAIQAILFKAVAEATAGAAHQGAQR